MIISGIQNNTMSTISNSQMALNMSVAKTQYTSIGNTVIITFRSQKTGPVIVNMLSVILKFSYSTRGSFLQVLFMQNIPSEDEYAICNKFRK